MIRRLTRSLFAIIALVPMASAVCFAQAQAVLTHHVRPVTSNGQAPLVGRMPASNTMRLTVVLPLRNQPQLSQLLQDLYNPSSASFHKFLTVPQFTERFAPTQADYNAVMSWAQSNHLAVASTSRNRLTLGVTGTVTAIEAALNVSMGLYQHPTENRTFYAPDREPTPNLSVKLWHIAGLDNYSTPHAAVVRRPSAAPQAVSSQAATPAATTGSCPEQSFCGSDMRAAYYQGTALTGAGQSLGLLEYLGTDLDDLNTYFANIGQTNSVPVTLVSTDGTSTSCVYPSCDDTEQTLDMTQALGMAPGLSSLVMYVGSTDVAILNAMATAEPLNAQLSSSWTWFPADPATDDPFFQAFAAQGQSYFQASGDSGEWQSFSEIFPADDPYVTTVGGTSLVTTGPGGPWSSETVWVDGGGGISPNHLPIPYWQTTSAASCSGCSVTFRNGPDVSANSDFTFYVCSDQQACTANYWGGTSFATPMWAGYLALVNQQSVANGGQTAGLINPAIYNIGLGSSYQADLHDITSGSNGFAATPGYDLATGWGSPSSGTGLISALAASDFFLSATPTSLTVGQGASNTYNLTLTSLNGFSGAADLSVSCPSGVTCTFSPQSVTVPAGSAASATLTVAVSSSAPGGTFKLAITATSGSITHTGPVNLTVVAPTFSIAANPSATSVDQGVTASYTVSLTSLNGFNKSVALTAASCPVQSTCSFSPSVVPVPNGGTATSVLSVRTGKKTPAGQYSVAISGTSGNINNGTSVQLTIFNRK